MFNKSLIALSLVIISGCGQNFSEESQAYDFDQISTFDYTLDKSIQDMLESKVDSALNPANLDKWMKHMSSKPHHGGSPWSKQNAEYAANLFKEWGYESSIETFEVLLPYPKIMKLSLVSPSRVSFKLDEPPVKGDKSTAITKDLLMPYNAFSADGNITAELVFVNYGIPADYIHLLENIHHL